MRAIESGVQGVAAATAAHDLRGCLLSAARCAACCELRVLAHAYLLVRLADLFRLQAVVRAGQRLHAFHLRSINSTHMRRRNTSATYCAAACPPPPPRVTAASACAACQPRHSMHALRPSSAPPHLFHAADAGSAAVAAVQLCQHLNRHVLGRRLQDYKAPPRRPRTPACLERKQLRLGRLAEADDVEAQQPPALRLGERPACSGDSGYLGRRQRVQRVLRRRGACSSNKNSTWRVTLPCCAQTPVPPARAARLPAKRMHTIAVRRALGRSRLAWSHTH